MFVLELRSERRGPLEMRLELVVALPADPPDAIASAVALWDSEAMRVGGYDGLQARVDRAASFGALLVVAIAKYE